MPWALKSSAMQPSLAPLIAWLSCDERTPAECGNRIAGNDLGLALRGLAKYPRTGLVLAGHGTTMSKHSIDSSGDLITVSFELTGSRRMSAFMYSQNCQKSPGAC